MAAQYGVPLLGSLPLQIGIREQGDAGTDHRGPAGFGAGPGLPPRRAARLIEECRQARPRASIPILSSLLPGQGRRPRPGPC